MWRTIGGSVTDGYDPVPDGLLYTLFVRPSLPELSVLCDIPVVFALITLGIGIPPYVIEWADNPERSSDIPERSSDRAR